MVLQNEEFYIYCKKMMFGFEEGPWKILRRAPGNFEECFGKSRKGIWEIPKRTLGNPEDKPLGND